MMKNAKKVLLIDDSIDYLEYVSLILQAHEFEVSTAVNGTHVLDLVKLHNPDLIIIDLNMPVGGLEVAGILKNAKVNIPMLMLTASDTKAFMDSAFLLGCIDYLTKDVEWDDLVQRVDTYCTIGQIEKRLNNIKNNLDTSPLTD